MIMELLQLIIAYLLVMMCLGMLLASILIYSPMQGVSIAITAMMLLGTLGLAKLYYKEFKESRR